MSKTVDNILTSIFIGFFTSAFLAALYGWFTFTSNADILSGQSITWSDDEVSALRNFFWDKTILLGTGLFGAFSITTYVILRGKDAVLYTEVLDFTQLKKDKFLAKPNKKTIPKKKKKSVTTTTKKPVTKKKKIKKKIE